MLKRKVGDIVTIKENLNVFITYDGEYIIPDMKIYEGKKAIVLKSYNDWLYDLDIDNQKHHWTNAMFINDDLIKSKRLTYEQILKLKDKQKVIVEDLKNNDIVICNFNSKGDTYGKHNAPVPILRYKTKTKHGYWDALSIQEELIYAYEYIEISQEQKSQETTPKQYTGDKILKMIRKGKLQDNDILIDNIKDEFTIEDIKEGWLSSAYLIDYAPFTIKKK